MRVDRSSVGFTQNGPNKLGHACVVLLRVPFGHSQSFTCVLRSGSIVNNAVAVVVSQSVSLSRGRISPASFFKRSIRFLIPPEFVRLRRERYASLPLLSSSYPLLSFYALGPISLSATSTEKEALDLLPSRTSRPTGHFGIVVRLFACLRFVARDAAPMVYLESLDIASQVC